MRIVCVLYSLLCLASSGTEAFAQSLLPATPAQAPIDLTSNDQYGRWTVDPAKSNDFYAGGILFKSGNASLSSSLEYDETNWESQKFKIVNPSARFAWQITRSFAFVVNAESSFSAPVTPHRMPSGQRPVGFVYQFGNGFAGYAGAQQQDHLAFMIGLTIKR